MTKKDLEELQALKREAKQLQEELQNLPFVPASVKGSMAEHPYIETTFKVFGVDERKGKAIRAKLDAVLENIQTQILIMEDWLDNITDSEMRTILRLYYRNGLTQAQIAGELGYSREGISHKLKAFWSNQEKCTTNTT